MTTRNWKRLSQIREQQERMARLKLATAAGRVREAMVIQDSFRQQADASNLVWEQLLGASVQASHWAAMASASAVQQQDLQAAEKNVRQARSVMEHVGNEHRETVVDKEMAQTLVDRQLAEERREAWLRLQYLIDEHTSASHHRERGLDDQDG